MMRNTGIFFERMRSRDKIPLMQKLLNIGILTWIAYGVVMIVYKIKIANQIIAAFPALGR